MPALLSSFLLAVYIKRKTVEKRFVDQQPNKYGRFIRSLAKTELIPYFFILHYIYQFRYMLLSTIFWKKFIFYYFFSNTNIFRSISKINSLRLRRFSYYKASQNNFEECILFGFSSKISIRVRTSYFYIKKTNPKRVRLFITPQASWNRKKYACVIIELRR